MSVTLSQVLSALREANTGVNRLQRRINAVDNAAIIRNLFSDGVFDTSGSGAEYGFKITASGMGLYCSETGTVTSGNISEAIAYGYYVAIDDSTGGPFATLSDGDATNPRYDIVWANRFKIGVAQGTPAASPADPAIPADAISLFRVTVPANETDGSGLTLTDLREFIEAIDISLKADKVTSATSGHVAGLDSAGNLTDAGFAPADKLDATEKGAASGLCPLDSSTKISSAYLPALALTDINVVADEASQLALTAQEGDVAVRSDLKKSYVHNGGSAGDMTDWTELQTPTDAVLSVAGKTGTVTLVKADVGLGNVENLKVNLAASAAPAVTDDSGAGYSVGSRWIDTTADKEYICLDATTGAAVWTETTQSGGSSSSSLGGAAAHGDTAASITFSTDTKVLFGTEDYDANAEFASSRFTAGRAGNLLITGVVELYNQSSSAAAFCYVKLFKNGVSIRDTRIKINYALGNWKLIPFNFGVAASSGDYFEIYVNCSQNMYINSSDGSASAGESSVSFQWVS